MEEAKQKQAVLEAKAEKQRQKAAAAEKEADAAAKVAAAAKKKTATAEEPRAPLATVQPSRGHGTKRASACDAPSGCKEDHGYRNLVRNSDRSCWGAGYLLDRLLCRACEGNIYENMATAGRDSVSLYCTICILDTVTDTRICTEACCPGCMEGNMGRPPRSERPLLALAAAGCSSRCSRPLQQAAAACSVRPAPGLLCRTAGAQQACRSRLCRPAVSAACYRRSNSCYKWL